MNSGESLNSPEVNQSTHWIARLNLSQSDRKVLIRDQWLNDWLINGINRMVANYIGSDAAQSTLLVQISDRFMAAATETVQIIHDSNHWITTTCIGGRVFVADSLQRSLSAYVVQQIKHCCTLRVSTPTVNFWWIWFTVKISITDTTVAYLLPHLHSSGHIATWTYVAHSMLVEWGNIWWNVWRMTHYSFPQGGSVWDEREAYVHDFFCIDIYLFSCFEDTVQCWSSKILFVLGTF